MAQAMKSAAGKSAKASKAPARRPFGKKSVEADSGADVVVAERSKEPDIAAKARSTTVATRKRVAAQKSGKPAVKTLGKATKAKADTSAEPSIARRMLQRVTGGIASLAGSIVGRH